MKQLDFTEMMKEGEQFVNFGQQSKSIANFEEKYDKFLSLIANTEGLPKHKRQFLMKEAESTSDFPTLFGTVLERTIRKKYNLVVPDWRKYIKVGTQNDFRTAWDMALYGNRQTLNVVKERGEYQAAQLGDGKFTINLKKYGRRFGLSWEAVINDDLGAFNDIASDLVLSATNTEAKFATSLFANSSGPDSTLFQVGGTHPIDGTSFTNKKTANAANNLSVTSLPTAITALKSQKDYDGNPIIFNRFVLVVPVALEFTALQVLSSAALIASQSNSAAAVVTSENVIAKYPITLAVNPWLDIIDSTAGTKTWYLFGDPSDGDAVKVNFLRGHETPEVVQKMSDKITLGGAPISPLEGDFDSDSVNWRVRHVLGGTVTDPRYAYAMIGA